MSERGQQLELNLGPPGFQTQASTPLLLQLPQTVQGPQGSQIAPYPLYVPPHKYTLGS